MAPKKARAMKAKKKAMKKSVMKAKKTAMKATKKAADPKMMPSGPGGLCIAGESLIDMLPRKTADGSACWLPAAGGAPFNALLAACRLGMPVSYFAPLSSDMFGEQLYGILAKEGVNLDLVTREDRPTTLAFVSREEGQGEKYAFFKENAADRALTKKQVQGVLKTHRFDAVHVSLGAITLEDKQMKDAFEALLRGAGKQGSLRTFDPNLRSNMIRGGANSYRKLMENFLGQVDIVKCSDDDIEFLYGHTKFEEVARKWLKSGPRLVIVTQGSKGATTYYPGGEINVAPPGTRPNTIDASGSGVPVVDTVGAGDTFQGSLIQGFLGNAKYEPVKDPPLMANLVSGNWDPSAVQQLRNVLERATVAAAINCSRPGCNPPSVAETAAAGRALGLKFAETL